MMLARYTLPEMGKVWSMENRFQRMLDVELAAVEARADLGQIPKEVYKEIKAKAGFTMQRIEELEILTGHDLVPFLEAVREQLGSELGRHFHWGLTSYDVIDTGLSLQMVQATELLTVRLNALRDVLRRMALEYKYTLMMGRTHGMHAEPITFGLKLLVWVKEIDRSLKRLQAAHDIINVGKISGTVGTYANIDPQIETYVCRSLGLHQPIAATQILQRDRHAEFVGTLAIIGCSLDKFATEIRNLQRSEILEVQEAHINNQRSSTMLHKHNPIMCERISGLARILRGYACPSLENIVLWHERDFAHAPSERIIVSESCILLDYMLYSFTQVMENLIVYPEHMRRNLELTLGLVFSQRVVFALMEQGLDDEEANRLVRRNAQMAWDQQIDFQYLILEDADIGQYLSREEIMDLFDYDYHLRRIDYIYQRAEL